MREGIKKNSNVLHWLRAKQSSLPPKAKEGTQRMTWNADEQGVTCLTGFTTAGNKLLLTAQPHEVLLIEVATILSKRWSPLGTPKPQRAVRRGRHQLATIHV